jgi:hypothetical protein
MMIAMREHQRAARVDHERAELGARLQASEQRAQRLEAELAACNEARKHHGVRP